MEFTEGMRIWAKMCSQYRECTEGCPMNNKCNIQNVIKNSKELEAILKKWLEEEDLLAELSMMIDDCIANGGTFFDVQVDSDASCFAYETKEE